MAYTGVMKTSSVGIRFKKIKSFNAYNSKFGIWNMNPFQSKWFETSFSFKFFKQAIPLYSQLNVYVLKF